MTLGSDMECSICVAATAKPQISLKNIMLTWKIEIFATRITIEEISLTTVDVSPSMLM